MKAAIFSTQSGSRILGWGKRILPGLIVLFLLIYVYVIAREILLPQIMLPTLPRTIESSTIVLMLFSLCHASYLLGARRALVFFVISAVVSWLFEQVGVATGLIYGPYHYTDQLGAKLGHVPVLIPLAWFMMIYPSYIIANLIVLYRPAGFATRAGPIVWLSLLSAVVMTAWDLPMDPQMSGSGHWVWEQGGAFFGVPLQNFAGWLLTTFTVYLLYRILEPRLGRRTDIQPSTLFASMPVIAYGAVTALYVLHETPEALRLIALFAMGLPTLLAAAQLLGLNRKHEDDLSGEMSHEH
jgi:uncharacterized membrane protein